MKLLPYCLLLHTLSHRLHLWCNLRCSNWVNTLKVLKIGPNSMSHRYTNMFPIYIWAHNLSIKDVLSLPIFFLEQHGSYLLIWIAFDIFLTLVVINIMVWTCMVTLSHFHVKHTGVSIFKLYKEEIIFSNKFLM